MDIKTQELKPARPDPQPLLTYEQLNMITSFERLWTQIAVWTKVLFQSVFIICLIWVKYRKGYSACPWILFYFCILLRNRFLEKICEPIDRISSMLHGSTRLG